AQLLEQALDGETYHASRVQEWTNTVCSQSASALQSLNSSFKYTVTCVVVEKKGGGVHTSSAACWEPEQDGCIVERWENSTILAIITVFACSM
ncbi:unnamed protein product, partial [Discosporangium mesarthrocarpum]